MKNYILFIFANFSDLEDLEFFCLEHFPQVSVDGLKYVIESNGSCIIIFDSDKEKDELITSLKETLTLDQIRFYMLFERGSILFSELPVDLSDFIFKPISSNVDMFKTKGKKKLKDEEKIVSLDDVLEKIQNEGIDALSPEEKKFLDNFGN
jgi:hypothetical protein